jgi:hypothetical protein
MLRVPSWLWFTLPSFSSPIPHTLVTCLGFRVASPAPSLCAPCLAEGVGALSLAPLSSIAQSQYVARVRFYLPTQTYSFIFPLNSSHSLLKI